jgi:hypothetical protein
MKEDIYVKRSSKSSVLEYYLNLNYGEIAMLFKLWENSYAIFP